MSKVFFLTRSRNCKLKVREESLKDKGISDD